MNTLFNPPCLKKTCVRLECLLQVIMAETKSFPNLLKVPNSSRTR